MAESTDFVTNVIEFPNPRTAEQREEAFSFARDKLATIAESVVESGLQRMWEVTRCSVPYWETLTLDDFVGLIGEAFRAELARRLPDQERLAQV